jgi:imidazoleglycerol-phosphate dehydratase
MAQIIRETKETNIIVKCDIYGTGSYKINTGVGFLNHMLETFSKHSRIDLDVTCKGDTHIDDHHSVEDVAIAIGQALYKDIFPVGAIKRFGNFSVVMDEALVEATMDISNRPFLFFGLELYGKVGDFDVELVEEFFRALAFNLNITLHLEQKRGKNKHHIIEATFKSFALCLRDALVKTDGDIPSTKGAI